MRGLDNIVRLAQAKGAETRNAERGALPAIDPGSRALTGAERKSLAEGITTGPNGSMTDVARRAPASYIGDRVRLAALRAQALEQYFQGNLRKEQAEALRCRTIAVAMDKRAGAYVVGGERTAEQVRNAISPEAVAKCREAVAQRTAMNDGRRVPVGISPDRAHSQAHSPQRIDPIGSERHRIDPVGSHRQRIDPTASVRQRIDPVASVRHRIDLSTSAGRGG